MVLERVLVRALNLLRTILLCNAETQRDRETQRAAREPLSRPPSQYPATVTSIDCLRVYTSTSGLQYRPTVAISGWHRVHFTKKATPAGLVCQCTPRRHRPLSGSAPAPPPAAVGVRASVCASGRARALSRV
eukprot:COSAG03_NODE_99_length_12968_cov_7.661668_2_plen_132_part_00